MVRSQQHTKKAAIELSIGTIVIIVLGVSMLILGMVLIRNIMCGALGLTKDVNSKVKGELDRYFGTSASEVACIGAIGEPVKITPGDNNVYCAIKAPVKADYSIKVLSFDSFAQGLTKEELKKWIVIDNWKGPVSPGDEEAKKAVFLKIPNNAPEGTIRLKVEIQKDNKFLQTSDLDFQISRVGFIKSAMC